MAAFIPEEKVAEVREKTDIVEVINDYVQLKKQGRHYLGLCPFHGENTPSFSVSPERQLYHCFGCGAGGNAITFLMEHDGLTFVEAIQSLAAKTGTELPELEDQYPGEREQHQAKKDAHQMAAKFYHHLLMNTEQGKEAYDYLTARGISEEIIEEFQLGYAPERNNMLVQLLEKRDYDLEEMEEAGLIFRQESSWQWNDRFRGRVMFPIHNQRGQIIAFGGRALGEGAPKYLNSPETPIFLKHETLYSFSKARQAIRKQDEAVLFEGYMDVIAAWKAGVKNGVAGLGTAFSKRQAEQIRKATDKAVIAYDGDNAGRTAAWKTGDILEKQDIDVRVAQFPADMDPDDYIQAYGAEAFNAQLSERAVPFMSFKVQELRKNKNLQNEGDRLVYIEEVLRETSMISSAVEREFYMKQLAEEFDLSMDALREEERKVQKKEKREQAAKAPSSEQTGKRWRSGALPKKQVSMRSAYENAERTLLAFMLQNREVAEEVKERIGGEFNIDAHTALAAYLYAYYDDDHEPDVSRFMEYVEEQELVNLVSELMHLDIPTEISDNEMSDYVEQIKIRPKREELLQRQKQLKDAERNGDSDTNQRQLLTRIMELMMQLKKN
ncbi:DNA primase [Marinococcus sp. PL1-022]|uniref:DNA primase n=1 Tax=Marinococcus sp. PL1-022 TaxID=3095363 RepID=UPI0029C1140A|nr:DNA primase [Marinococcus sp. PL1-022]MDX6153319.1 DNA primase [Marinococcus sp. PL1-022]